MSAQRVFIYVQHLLGIGHLKRAATLARAMAAEGLEVTLASGGPPVESIAGPLSSSGVRVAQLPPASAKDLGFKVLVDEDGRDVDSQWQARRSAALQDAWHAADAQVLLIELFPFGRRQMRFELLPLLEAARARARPPAIVCSVRDVLGGQKSAERQAETAALIERWFDAVMVHGDPAVLGFERTFPLAARIAGKLHYTGYVLADPGPPGGAAGTDEVIVSAGGGAVGLPLLEAALASKGLSAARHRRWRLLAGDHLPEAAYRKLATRAATDPQVVLERSRADFTTLLANCALSVSQAGYNTLLETVQARARAVVVPFAGGSETEQTLRARHFAQRGLLHLIEEVALDAQALASAIDRALAGPRPQPGAVDLGGARRSAALVAQWAAGRPA